MQFMPKKNAKNRQSYIIQENSQNVSNKGGQNDQGGHTDRVPEINRIRF